MNFSPLFHLAYTYMHFQVISGDLKDVCMPSAFKFCQSQPSCPILVASERREHSPWNSEDKQGPLPGRLVSLRRCWLLLILMQLLSDEIWGKLAFRDTSKILLTFYLKFRHYSFNKYHLNTYCVPDISLSAKDTVIF